THAVTLQVECLVGDIFNHPAQCILSPANSLLKYDGGIDALIQQNITGGVEKQLRKRAQTEFGCIVPVGSAIHSTTQDKRWPNIIAPPTMMIPEDVSNTRNAFWAFRAAILKAKENQISEIVSPCFCSGWGRMPPRKMAVQLKLALEFAMNPRLPSEALFHTMANRMLTQV
ncbi:macro domain-containing protein, partial [Vibrio breoganii]